MPILLFLLFVLSGCVTSGLVDEPTDRTPTPIITPTPGLSDSDTANILATFEASLVRTVNGYTIEKYADLRGVDLSGADLVETLFAYADLTEANLAGADLEHADGVGALLDGATLSGANLGAALLEGV